ncbi:hypothetical protein EVAR_62915_1 [Eumeta japonica]|uniref:Uncharacterized protein n=1 Tax=Eumeta variegata TaxID=151549 RepID=A0A4C1YAL5_EUMVA|nr:hypothetical protein EVAR_62915_1 [Eumeta japonica]
MWSLYFLTMFLMAHAHGQGISFYGMVEDVVEYAKNLSAVLRYFVKFKSGRSIIVLNRCPVGMERFGDFHRASREIAHAAEGGRTSIIKMVMMQSLAAFERHGPARMLSSMPPYLKKKGCGMVCLSSAAIEISKVHCEGIKQRSL